MSSLTEEQKEIIEYEGDCFVLASPGSGKTHSLVEKINYIKSRNPLAKILYITFTRRAKQEGKDRIKVKEGVDIFNYHGFSYMVMESHKKVLKVSEIDIVNDSYCFKILEDLFPGKTVEEYQEILQEINKLKVNEVAVAEMTPQQKAVYIPYQEILYNQKKFTYSCMLSTATSIIDLNQLEPRIRSKIKYDYVMADEIQDVAHDQLHLLQSLKNLNPDSKLTMVGDLFQCIFQFAQARPDLVLPIIDKYNCKVFPLSLNFRSQENIVTLANGILDQIQEYKELRPLLVSTKPKSEKIHLRCYKTPYEVAPYLASNWQYQCVIKDIFRVKEEKGYKFSDIFVLYRMNRSGFNFEREAIKQRLPIRLLKGSFLERRAIQLAISTIKLSEYMCRDEIESELLYSYLKEVLPEIANDVGDKTLDLINSHNKDMSLIDRLHNVHKLDIKGIGSKREISIKEFALLLDSLTSSYSIYKQEDNLEKFLHYIKQFVGKMKSLRSAQYRDAAGEDLDDFFDFIFEAEGSVIERVNSIMVDFSPDESNKKEEDKVLGLSVHRAKGAEAKAVFIIDFDLFPPREEGISEEQRVLYVAVTRAKEVLYLSQNTNYHEMLKVFKDLEDKKILDSNFNIGSALSYYSSRKEEDPEFVLKMRGLRRR